MLALVSVSIIQAQEDSDTLVKSRPDTAFMAQTLPTVFTLNAGDSAYAKGEYLTAAEIYEGVLRTKGKSAELYYNMGNAYYKAGDIAHAILNYERSLTLNPGDKDARFNLLMAQSKMVDKVGGDNTFFLVSWLNSLYSTMKADAWALLAVIFFILFIVSLSFYIFSRRMLFKKSGFAVAIVSLVLVIVCNMAASHLEGLIVDRSRAIVMKPSVTVRSTPSETGPELFILHEGRKVKITDNSMREWKEIEIEDGNEGWVPVDAIEII